MLYRLATILAAFVCTGPFLLGCGESVDYPDTAPLTGKVTLDGQPVEGASVMLRPVGDPAKTHSARATSGPDGTFVVHTFFSASQDPEGAVPGKYQVSVVKYEQSGGGAVSAESHGAAGADTEAMKKAYQQGARRSGPGGHSAQGPGRAAAMAGLGGQNLLPPQYADPTTSGLEVEVKEGQENTLALELKSK